MQPLIYKWETVQLEAANIREDYDKAQTGRARNAAVTQLLELREGILSQIRETTVLDPACGSGNFLYVSLQLLMNLEKDVIEHKLWSGLQRAAPEVHPRQMYGIEKDPIAHALASIVVWIGYIQWHQANGFPYTQRPILTPLDTIRQTDAILDLSDPDNPAEPEWPAAEFIVGNPPFLGSRLFLAQFGDEYVGTLYGLYGKRIPNSSDLCCYWFEKARSQVVAGMTLRAGLLATQGIRFQRNRRVLARIKESGDIFAAYSDRDWVLDGANVHISIVCFDDGSEPIRLLDDEVVDQINIDLTSTVDLTLAKRLHENIDIAFRGIDKIGEFDIDEATAQSMMGQANPDGRINGDVIKPWINGKDITERRRNVWIIDFGVNTPEQEAALYEPLVLV